MKIMSVQLCSRIVITVCLFLVSASALAGSYYRWVDAEGITHYGETPPKGVDAVLVSTYGDTSSAPAQASSGPSESNPAPAVDSEQQRKLQAQRQEECALERDRLNTLRTSGTRIRMAQPDGSSRYLTPEEIQSEIRQSEEFITQACSG